MLLINSLFGGLCIVLTVWVTIDKIFPIMSDLLDRVYEKNPLYIWFGLWIFFSMLILITNYHFAK